VLTDPPEATINCALDLPCKLDIAMAPEGTSASALTGAAPMFICEKKHIDEIIEKLRTGITNYSKSKKN
jgi:hypothetical protein